MKLDIRTTIILLLTLAVIVLSTCNGCYKKRYEKLKADCANRPANTIIKHDTIVIHEQAQFVDHAPIPVKTDNPKIQVKWHFDTLYVENFNNITDTVYLDTLVSRYYATNYYKKKFQNQYGTFTTSDTVFNNRLIGNGLAVDLSIPVATKTVYKSKAALYFGIDAYGNIRAIKRWRFLINVPNTKGFKLPDWKLFHFSTIAQFQSINIVSSN